MWNRKIAGLAAIIGVLLLLPAGLSAGDEEGCLFCHRLGLRIPEAGGFRSLQVPEHPGAVHGSLYCSDCHPDARVAPHPSTPGPSSCVGPCHGEGETDGPKHRRASAGGATETHRAVSFPRSPCLLCHRAEDRAGMAEGTAARCAGCHPGKRADVRTGIHSRVAAVAGDAGCITCHPPHARETGEVRGSCAGTGCHDRVDEPMRRLSSHRNREGAPSAARRILPGGPFLAIALALWYGGRSISRRRDGRGTLP